MASGMNLTSFFDGNSLWLLPSSYQTATVTTTAESGAGTLRAAISQANAASVFTLIAFNIPTSDSGYNARTGAWTIAPTSALPTITNPVLIDGATQPGYAGKPRIDLSGTNAGANARGLLLRAGYSTITGLAINIFKDWGIELTGNTALDDTSAGNYIGVDKTGATTLGNVGDGIDIFNGVQSNLIGGSTPSMGNVISGNHTNGVLISDAGTTGNLLEGNYIGTNVAGTTAFISAALTWAAMSSTKIISRIREPFAGSVRLPNVRIGDAEQRGIEDTMRHHYEIDCDKQMPVRIQVKRLSSALGVYPRRQ